MSGWRKRQIAEQVEKKWYEYLQGTRDHTPGEDLADTLVLIVIMAMIVALVCSM